MRVLAGLALAVALGMTGCATRAQSVPGRGALVWFRITFGVGDRAPADWSGSVQAQGAQLRPWRFDRDDRIDGATSWKCSTRLASVADPRDWYVGALHVVPTNMTPPPATMRTNGIYLAVDGAAAVRVSTAQGEFNFNAREAPLGGVLKRLDGRVDIERVAAGSVVSAGSGLEEDYPSIAIDSAGRAWVAWVAYKAEKETLYVARAEGSERTAVAEGEFFRPVLAAGPRGELHVAVAVNTRTTWRIATARKTAGGWGKLETISAGGPDHSARAAVDSRGRLWVVWQGFRGGRSRILARVAGATDEIVVSENTRNAWEPSIAAGPNGSMHFAWDAYDAGHYDVYYRAHDGTRLAPQRRITMSPSLEAHASVAADPSGRVWIAWDEAGANWGKDTGFLIDRNNRATRLYDGRRVRVAAIDGGALKGVDFPDQHFEQPQLVVSESRVWCLARRREQKLHAVYSPSLQRDRLQPYSLWDFVVFASTPAGWSRPIELAPGWGRNDTRASIAAHGDLVSAAWSGDGRQFSRPYPPARNQVYTAALHDLAGKAAQPAVRAFTESSGSAAAVHEAEAFQVERIRSSTIRAEGKELKLLRGDMHRHTDLSFDGDIDGSLWDFYRYMLDAADFDYGAVTEHNAGDDIEYFWWLIQKSCDLFHYPGRFTPLYAYERSLRYPNGHRNLIWSKRGVRTLPRSPAEESGQEGAARLYAYLRATGGLAMSHTSATLMGTDWRDNDPALEPLVEIYQGDRTSYEHEGATRAARGKEPFTQPGGYQPAGFVWNAWAKGYKLGVQASSDHASTHVSYAVILAEANTRESILKAIAARHAYGATDNILLDFRCGDRVQGDVFTTSERPRLRVDALGTAPIARIDIIRNNQYVFTHHPGGTAVDVVFEDQDPPEKENYYYARIQQTDGQLAWSSPMWITYRK